MPNRRAALEKFLDNKLPDAVDDARLFAGSAGESPSRYSRSPDIWNAAFREIGLDAAYCAFDVRSENLAGFLAALREQPGFMGGNVTSPHKLAIMELLDDIDPLARQIGAVNTYARGADDKLRGYNSDVDGLLGSILRTLPGRSGPFMETLTGKRVLLTGAGGAGRASAFALASKLEGGTLAITNRTMAGAEELAGEVSSAYSGVSAVALPDAVALLPELDLVVNASTVGQSGLRHLPGGKLTCLEPFSPLAPANPVVLSDLGAMGGSAERGAELAPQQSNESAFYRRWFEESLPAIAANQAAAAKALLGCRPGTAFVDAIYSPDETVMLRQARLAGHRTLNGKGMLIMQAAESFINRMTRRHLIEAGYDPDTLYDRVVSTMAAAF